jgi:SAM-dependent methyltransferase
MNQPPGIALQAHIPRLLGEWRRESDANLRRDDRGPSGGRIASGSDDQRLWDSELRSVSSSLLRLQRGLTGDRALAGEPYMEDRGLLGAYLLYYWPVSYLQTAMALEELSASGSRERTVGDRVPYPEFRRILDIGSGPGPASAAFLDRGASSFTLLDSGKKALALARRLLEGSGSRHEPGSQGDSPVPDDPTTVSTILADLEAPASLPPGPFDAIVMSHSLNELWRSDPSRDEKRLRFLEKLPPLLSENGILLIVEPALLSTSRELLGLRDRLVSGRTGLELAAPCPATYPFPASYPCPAIACGQNRSCHSEYPWKVPEPVASIAAAAGLDRISVKACWLAFRAGKPGASSAEPSCRQSVPKPSIAGRVVSEPMLNKAGRIRYIVCSGSGLATVSAAADDTHARAQGFMELARGDGVEFGALETRPGAGGGSDSQASYGFGAASRIVSRVPAPKP